MEYDGFNEYNDPDATACALGDYNTWEEGQVFLDDEGGRWDDEDDEFQLGCGDFGSDFEDPYDYFED
jgi:hypothetical protein